MKTDLTEEEYETNLIELKRAALNLMGISMDHETVKTIAKVFNVIENKLGDTTLRDIMQHLVKEEEKEPESAGETLTKGKHQAKLIWNNINHTEIINFDTYDTKSSHSIEFYFIDEDKGEIPITRINTELVSVIILK